MSGCGAGDRALAGHRVGDRDAERLGERLQRRVGAATDGRRRRPASAAASPSRAAARRARGRPPSGRQRSAGACRVRLVDPRTRRPRSRCVAVADVLRHVEHDRARPARGRDREGAAHQLGDALDRLDADQLLAGRRAGSRPAGVSCVMFFQECARWVSPTMATSGEPALSASTRPVTRLVAPGPSVASQTPTPARDLAHRRRRRRRAQRSSLIRWWSRPSRRTAS